MTEMKTTKKNSPPTSADLIQPSAGKVHDPEQTEVAPAAASSRPHPQADEKEEAVIQSPLPGVDAMLLETQPGPLPSGFPMRLIWILSAVIVTLLLVLVLIAIRPKSDTITNEVQSREPIQENKATADDYASIVPRDLLIPEVKISQAILTDDDFAGQASGSVRASGPVFSQDIDPQLAALADACKKHLQALQGSQIVVRNGTRTEVTKGEFRGFKVNAVDQIENQKVISSEITVTTPKHGFIKTVNHVLEAAKETDFPRLSTEIQDAGLQFILLPAADPGNRVEVQLRSVRFFGKPVPAEWLVSGKSVGRITLGMPVAQMERLFIESHIVLKRKILVNDEYFDVYKILDKGNDPLFYVYENKGKVWGISLISEIFKTEKGIGIGSNLGSMRINYPQIKLSHSEKKTPYVQLQEIAGLFIIQGDGIDFAKNIFPNENKVISILIGNSPEFE